MNTTQAFFDRVSVRRWPPLARPLWPWPKLRPRPRCGQRQGHDGKGKGAHFKKADKNSDGFLTKDEVGEKRWDRIQVADANKDGKVSQPEMQQARKDGKLGHGKPSKKA